MKFFALLSVAPLLALASPGLAQNDGPHGATPDPAATAVAPEREWKTTPVAIETTLGTITVALETERAPITSANFLRYADQHRLDGTVFYRVLKLEWGQQPNGLIQGGAQNDPDRILPPIAHEPTDKTGLSHVRGALSMARYAPGSATADFTIMVGDVTSLDADPKSEDPDQQAGFAVFGHVTGGMDVVEAIYGQPIDPEKGEAFLKGQLLAQPVKIVRISRVEAP